MKRFESARETSYSVLPITKVAHKNHIELVRAEEGLGKGMSWGRVLHRLFEAMLRDESIDVRLYAENLLKDEERDVVELTEVMRVVEAVQSSPLWQRVKSADERYVEIPFALEVPAAELGLDGPPDTLLHGTIDLVFRERNEWFVVDYKTDATANRLDARSPSTTHRRSVSTRTSGRVSRRPPPAGGCSLSVGVWRDGWDCRFPSEPPVVYPASGASSCAVFSTDVRNVRGSIAGYRYN